MKNKVLNYIKENKMIEAGESVVIGVSGGADSMCLLNIMENIGRPLKLRLVAVHIHHGIREETADRDAAFVEDYCREHGIECIVKHFDVPALANQWGMSEEEAGRRVRYETFNQVLEDMNKENGCEAGGKIAVAHNADDSAETVLLNLFRGSSIKGMAGILPVRGRIIRPVLCLTRQEIEAYNGANHVAYVHDETNFAAEYTRNKLRLHILPAIKEAINPRAAEHINMAGQSLAEIDDYMEQECERIFGDIAAVRNEAGHKGIYIKTKDFLKLHAAMQAQLVKRCLYTVAGRAKDITGRHMRSVKELFIMEVGKSVNLPYSMVAVKEYEGVIIKKQADEPAVSGDIIKREVVMAHEGTYQLAVGDSIVEISIEKDTFRECIFEENMYTKWIAYDIMDSNLLLRTRREGDYIIVDDKGSKKKLKDFFIDKKIPREDRERICLVTRGSEVIWIVGYRLSAAYRVERAAKSILKLHVELRR